MDSAIAYHSYTVVRENWLTRRLEPTAAARAAFVTLLLIFGALLYWTDTWKMGEWMAATPAQVFGAHQWWRAWTTLFVHGDLRHLLSNTFMFFVVGIFLISYFGSLIFPFMAFACGGLMNLIVLRSMPTDMQLIGASGVVYWMGAVWLTLYFLIDRRRSIFQRALRALGVAIGLFMPTEAFDPSISYMSHLWGFVLGVGFAFLYYAIRRLTFLAAEVRESIVEEV